MFPTYMYDEDVQAAAEINYLTWDDGFGTTSRFHIARCIFPYGQMVLHSGRGIEGYCSSCILSRYIDDPFTASWERITGGGTLLTHDPEGKWLYVAEMDFLPEVEYAQCCEFFYFRLRLLAKEFGLLGLIHYQTLTEDLDEAAFFKKTEAFYSQGFTAHSVTNNFRKQHGQITTGVHFIWRFPNDG